jgi:hypothetical protein
MTCIIGIGDAHRVWMGADSAGMNADTYYHRVRMDEKMFIVNQNQQKMLLGFSNSFRMGQLLRYSLKLPPKSEQQTDYQYMCTDFINAVRSCLDLGGFTRIECNNEIGGTFLIGFNGVIYGIDNDFQVAIPSPNWESIGCGSYFAMGSLFTTQKVQNQEKRVRVALEAAAFFSGGVLPPLHILSL